MNLVRDYHARPVKHPSRWGSLALPGDRYLIWLLVLFGLSLPLVTHRVYASDEVQYFAYLRSVWFDRDLDFTNEYTTFIQRYPESLAGLKRTNLDGLDDRGQPITRRTSLPLNFGPIGTAILWLPYYAVGHLLALALHAINPAIAVDGYSAPYIVAITTGTAINAALALLLLFRLASRLVSPAAAFWATIAIWLGTPVIFYSHGAPAYSHIASILAVTLFLTLWQTSRPLASRSATTWLGLGLLAALVTAVREQDGVIPVAILAAELLMTVNQWRTPLMPAAIGPGPVRLIGHGLLFGLAWVVAFTPQIATYCILNGNCLPNNHVTQKMESGLESGLLQRAYDVMLNPQYGLVFWTPLVVPALLGLAWLWRRDRTLTLALLLTILATWLVNAIYSTGPTRGSFGARRFLNSTPALLLGLAALYQALRDRRLGLVVPLLTGLGIWWNIGLVVQFAFNLMNRQRLDLDRIFINQFTSLPEELIRRGYRLLVDRNSLFKN